jgi:hypothetical protein
MIFVDEAVKTNWETIELRRPATAGSEHVGIWNFSVASELHFWLQEICRSQSWDESTVLVSAFQELLRRYTNQSSIMVRFQREDAFECNLRLDDQLSFQDVVQRNAISLGSTVSILHFTTTTVFTAARTIATCDRQSN